MDADTLGEAARVVLAPFRSADPDDRQFDQLELTFTSSGYYDPGRYSGHPENCSPEEYDDERLLDGVVLDASFGNEVRTIPLSEAVLRILRNDPVVEKEIRDADLVPDDGPDGPDHWTTEGR